MAIDPLQFVLQNTSVAPVPMVPEIVIRTAGEAHDLWQKTEAELNDIGLPPPFWAFPWAGGQALARYILDHPAKIAGKRVMDFASGSGLVAIAAAKAGARSVHAVDIDPFSLTAATLNMALNDVKLELSQDNVIGDLLDDVDVVLAGDVFYDQAFASEATAWFRMLAGRGIIVIAGDPGRVYRPTTGVVQLARYDVPVVSALEDSQRKETTIFAVQPG